LTPSRTLPRLKTVLNIIFNIRYATLDIFKGLKHPAFIHICTAPSFSKLVNLKILAEPKAGVFCLGTVGFNIVGQKARQMDGGGEHDLAVSRLVLQAITETDATVIYPKFERLRLYPDALIIYRGEGKYRLEFLEVERTVKADPEYMERKFKKYRALAKDPTLYTDWWQEHRGRLNLPPCGIDKFCFGVRVENVGS